MALKLISGNASHLGGLLFSSVSKPLAGVLRVKFLALLVMLFLYIWTHVYVYTLHVCTRMGAPQPLLSPSDAPVLLQRTSMGTCPTSPWVPCLQARGRSRSALSLLARLVILTRCFCLCLAIEKEIKWEKEEAVSKEKIFLMVIGGI